MAVLGLMGLGPGCVIPEEDIFLAPDGYIKNHPLRVVEERVNPSNRLITVEAGDPCTLPFSIIVDDPDLDVTDFERLDRVTYRWFVTGTGTPQLVLQGILPASKLASYDIILDQAGSPLTTPGIYTVDVRVTDGVFTDHTLGSGVEKRQRGDLVDLSYVDSYSWTVNLTTNVSNCVSPSEAPRP